MNCKLCGYVFADGETPNYQTDGLPDVPLCGECDYQISKGNRKVIIKGRMVDDEQLYWSNTLGWVDRSSATIFDVEEVIDGPPLVEQVGLEYHNLYA